MAEHGGSQPFSLRDEETICFIPEDLRLIVVHIIKADSPGKLVSATRALYEKATHDDPYLVASSMYDFLWKRVAMESRKKLYPIVGDFFLTALEQKLGKTGPNNLRSRYRELMECYNGAGDLHRRLEGPLYCADLFLLKTTQLALGGKLTVADNSEQASDMTRAEFLGDQKLSVSQQIADSLELARDALLDSQELLTKSMRQGLSENPKYIECIRASIDRLTLTWQQWQEMHTGKNVSEISPEAYFKEGISRAEKINSLVLAAMLLEQVGEEYQDKMCREFLQHKFSNKPVDHMRRGCTFDAGEIYRDQGIIERSCGAFILGERRFTRAIEVFGHLHDRTSIAQTLIERARLYMIQKTDVWKARSDLHEAVKNLAAAHRRIPPGAPLPELTADNVEKFYEDKGLLQEAAVYREQQALLREE